MMNEITELIPQLTWDECDQLINLLEIRQFDLEFEMDSIGRIQRYFRDRNIRLTIDEVNMLVETHSPKPNQSYLNYCADLISTYIEQKSSQSELSRKRNQLENDQKFYRLLKVLMDDPKSISKDQLIELKSYHFPERHHVWEITNEEGLSLRELVPEDLYIYANELFGLNEY